MNAARNTRVFDSRRLRATRSAARGGDDNTVSNARTIAPRHETGARGRGLLPRLADRVVLRVTSRACFQNETRVFYRSGSMFFLFFSRLFSRPIPCHPRGSKRRDSVAFSFFGATRGSARHNSHGHQHRRLSPTLHQQPCVKSSPSTSARPVSRPVTRAGSCTASSTVSSLSTSTTGNTLFPGSFENCPFGLSELPRSPRTEGREPRDARRTRWLERRGTVLGNCPAATPPARSPNDVHRAARGPRDRSREADFPV